MNSENTSTTSSYESDNMYTPMGATFYVLALAPREELEMLIVIAWRDLIALEEERAAAEEGDWDDEKELDLALTYLIIRLMEARLDELTWEVHGILLNGV